MPFAFAAGAVSSSCERAEPHGELEHKGLNRVHRR
jgi:hypothetical protein